MYTVLACVFSLVCLCARLPPKSTRLRRTISLQTDFLVYTALSFMKPRHFRESVATISEVTDSDSQKYGSLCGNLITVVLISLVGHSATRKIIFTFLPLQCLPLSVMSLPKLVKQFQPCMESESFITVYTRSPATDPYTEPGESNQYTSTPFL